MRGKAALVRISHPRARTEATMAQRFPAMKQTLALDALPSATVYFHG